MKRRQYLLRTLLVVGAVFVSVLTVRGASITGRITDTEGAPVPGAQINVREDQSDFSRAAVTQEDGSYFFDSLPPGVYAVTVRKSGFNPLVQKKVTVGDGDGAVQLNLRVGSNRRQTGMSGAEELNPNVFVVKLDANAIVRQLYNRGANPQFPREFRSQENSYGALYGYPLRKVELVRPRTLLPAFHGSLYGFHQNSALNARSFFTVGKLRPARRNEYGGTIGGPLSRDKASIYFAGSQVRDSGYVNGNVQVPLLEERAPRSPDPRVNALIARMLEGYPKELPNLPHLSPRHLNTNAVRDIRSTAFSTRLDYRPRAMDQLAFEQRFFDSTEQPFELVAGQNPVTFLRPQSYHLTYIYTHSPQTLARLSYNFDRLAARLDVTEQYKNLLAPLGISPVPEISFGRSGDLQNLGPGFSFPRKRVENRFHIAPEVSHVRGSHRLSGGFLLSRLQINDLQSDNSRGVFDFNTNFGRSAVENFLLGRPTRFKINLGEFYRGFRNWEHGFYFHDIIQLKTGWTLSLGLRHEVITVPSEVNQLTAIPYRTDANNFAPQFGFAWNPGGGKTVVRGGYGIAFGTIFPVMYQRARFNPPAVRVISIDDPNLIDPLGGMELASSGTQRSGLNLLSPDLVAPYTHLYTLTIERELPAGLSLRVGYMGSRTFQLPWEVVSNRAKPVPGIETNTRTINQRRPDPGFLEINTVTNGSIAYFDALQVAAEKRLGQRLTWSARYTFSKAINSGDATFADIGTGRHISMDDDIIGDLKGPSAFDTPHALAIAYRFQLPGPGRSRGLLTQLLGGWQASGNITLRSGTPYMVHTGSDAPGFGNVDGVGGDRPNLLNPSILGKSVDHPDTFRSVLRPEFFDTNIPFGGRGNLGFNNIRSDAMNNWNLAVVKDFLFRGGEQTPAVQFRAEFYNLLNHPQFDFFAPHVANEIFGKITNTVNRGRIVQFMLRLRL